MAGSLIDDDWELAYSLNGARNIVLVGRTGNGKSATGNSILGRKAFKSRASSAGVTGTCELQRAVLRDGHILNVIDTPGLFDFSAETGFIGKEIVKCFKMAKDGIHAVILVFSVMTRFSKEEDAALHCLQTLFESKINDYLIVVFTGGDLLGENRTLEDYLGFGCPEPLKEILHSCKNRRVLFDNKTDDEFKKADQLKQLITLIDVVIEQNGGHPYTDEVFAQWKQIHLCWTEGATELRLQKEEANSLVAGCSNQNQEISELTAKLSRSYEDQIKRITETVESKLKESIRSLEQQLAEERAARLKAVENARAMSNDEIFKLGERLERKSNDLGERLERKSNDLGERLERETEDLRKRAERGNCSIL